MRGGCGTRAVEFHWAARIATAPKEVKKRMMPFFAHRPQEYPFRLHSNKKFCHYISILHPIHAGLFYLYLPMHHVRLQKIMPSPKTENENASPSGSATADKIPPFQSRKIVFLGFILSIAVMVRHAGNTAYYQHLPDGPMRLANYAVQTFFSDFIGGAAVPMFFIISAFLFFTNYTTALWPSKVKSRIGTLLVPYLIWSAFALALFSAACALPPVAERMNGGMGGVNFTPLCILKDIVTARFAEVLWFIYQLMAYILLSPAIYLAAKNRRTFAVSAIALFAYLSAWCTDYMEGSILTIRPAGLFYYLLGAGMALHFRSATLVQTGWRQTLAMGAGGAVCFICQKCLDIPFLFISYTLLMCAFFWQAAGLLMPKTLGWIMHISFYIYASHIFLVIPIKKALFFALPKTGFFSLLNYVLSVAMTAAIVFASAYFISKKFPFLWKLINGGRGKAAASRKKIAGNTSPA